ncbi:MAG: NADH:ubiquinone oxidoreductase [Pseudomonadota bacterium]|uniref:NADH:ubiquinone oxidoreductase n=1 Tax=Candidatus Desulfatibia profunda TaxID=2841695 RepID=A0A8J6NQB7_9BACT|nr:NADH:ubiquinone oxidoreductase [Candidatus Desulfatibia profunda]MBL7179384.1 NADH:ubiquinone oxidoreductase [Desulfobacterales bacterium]
MEYLGIKPNKPKVAVFDFTGCEGCELQLVNKEDTLIDFLKAIDLRGFRKASTAINDDYDIALIEGAISRDDEIKRLEKIRSRAKVLVAMGSCACFGGVNKMKNDFDLQKANKEVYGDNPKETAKVKAIKDVVKVDLEIPGCPISKDEVESIIKHLVWGMPFSYPVYPVCLECKQRFTTCMFEKGQLCLGPITKAGCKAPCPAGGLGCWGCRGPARDPNYESFLAIVEERGFTPAEVNERLNFFGGFQEINAR